MLIGRAIGRRTLIARRLACGAAVLAASLLASGAPAWAAALAGQDELRPLKPAVGPNLWLPALLGALACAVLLGLLARLPGRRVARESAAELAPAPSGGTLRGRLEQVLAAGWIEGGQHLRACEAIAEVLRDLARSRWVVSSPRLTTAELMSQLSARGAEPEITGPLAAVLEACDLVKFAGARLRDDDLRAHLDTAFLLVDVYGSGAVFEAVRDTIARAAFQVRPDAGPAS